jgi:hypothetical protein
MSAVIYAYPVKLGPNQGNDSEEGLTLDTDE